MSQLKDLRGLRFGKLLALRHSRTERRDGGTRPRQYNYWICLCDCGAEKECRSSDLLVGATKSCGAHRSEFSGTKVHGLTDSTEYKIWTSIKTRCKNSHSIGYKNYGGRGIALCDRWELFENFLADMGERQSPKHSIERIDNDKGYGPDNCKWATLHEQANNRRTNLVLEFNGESLTAKQWAAKTGISIHAIYQRIKAGWSTERVLTEGVGDYFRRCA